MSQTQDQKLAVCGNCKRFVVGGQCERVQGEIRVEDVCDIHEPGDPYAYGFPTIPSIPKIEVNYRPAYWDQLQDGEYSPMEMREALTRSAIQSEIDRMMEYGIDPTEILRTIQSYIFDPNKDIIEWPPMTLGLDNLANINTAKVPSTGEPPIYQPNTPGPTQPYWVPPYNPYPNNPTPDPLGAVKTDPSVSRTYNITNPPVKQDSDVWLGLASDKGSEPPTIGVTGYNINKDPPRSIEGIYPNPDMPHINIPPSDGAPQFREITGDELKAKKKSLLDKMRPWLALLGGIGAAGVMAEYLSREESPRLLAKYHYRRHEADDVCNQYNGQVFDLLDTTNRPVIPSENLGYVTTHPNCQCYWTPQKTAKQTGTLTRKQQSDIEQIKGDITKKANSGELHTVKADGSLSKRTRKSNPIREALIEIRQEFGWLTDDYISKARKVAEDARGQLFIIRAASEAITDHRREGEPLRRKLSGDELIRLARTAIGKGMDVNHTPEFRTDATVIDSEYDDATRQIQMLVLENDPEIINAVNNGIISAVSINGGSPRSETIEPCDEHCETNCELCLVPKGVVLGELDDIALTWVVTDPMGLNWKGMNVPAATPGVKTTAIQPL